MLQIEMIGKISLLGKPGEYLVVQCQMIDNSLYRAAVFLSDTKASFHRDKQKKV